MRNVVKLALLSCCLTSHANVIQYFTGISYSNPAELFKVKQSEFIVGATAFNTQGRFQGTQLNFNTFGYDYGVSKNNTTSLLPYGRIAQRLNKKLVFAVDLTEPFHSNLNWGNDSFTKYAATQNYITDIDVSPRLSFALSPTWFIGAGLNFNFLKNNETNWALPSGPTTSANMINRTSGFALGYNLGIYHIFNPTNFMGLAFYSRKKQDTYGTSTFQNNINTRLSFNFSMPATALLNYVHIFNEKWLTSLTLFHTDWSVNQMVNFINTSAPPPMNPNFSFSVKYRRSFAIIAALRHQLKQKLGLTAVGMLDGGPERDEYRSLNFPAETQYFLGLAADYHPNQATTLEFLYGYGFSKARLSNSVNIGGQSLPFTTGKVNIYANVFELKLKIQK